MNKEKVCERIDPDMSPSTSRGHTGTLLKQKEIAQTMNAPTEVSLIDPIP